MHAGRCRAAVVVAGAFAGWAVGGPPNLVVTGANLKDACSHVRSERPQPDIVGTAGRHPSLPHGVSLVSVHPKAPLQIPFLMLLPTKS